MGKSLPTITRLTRNHNLPKIHFKSPHSHRNPISESQITVRDLPNSKVKTMASSVAEKESTCNRLPLSAVVADCVKRWFMDTLKEAKSGDINTQVLVSQMYYSGYGVPRDAHKGKIWMTRASRTRSSVWKVRDKHPGYNASDSDSDQLQTDS